MNKTLVTVVTRNNPVLLQNFISSIERNDAGTPYDLVIADNTSDDPKHLKLLDKLSKKYKIEVCENDRAETSYNTISQKYLKNDEYDYFFFLHDDTYAYKENWLKVYIDRLNSNYYEPEISNTHLIRYPVGRVSGCSQPYRDFTSCKGFPLPSMFLQAYLNSEPELKDSVWIYKYSDQERVLYSRECLKSCGMFYLKYWKDLKDKDSEKLKKIKIILNQYLQYYDEGMGPKDKYPPDESWCKLMLLTEFLNSVYPLINGYRTIGLEGDGDLEQISGYDVPWGHNFIVHYGSCNMKRFLAKELKTTSEEIHKRLYTNDLTFITKCNKIIENYYDR